MSRHSVETTHEGRPVVVTIGWDAPLGYFHAVIERLDVTDDEESPFVYSNLDDTDPFPVSLDPYRAKFRALGIEIPDRMFLEAASDALRNVVNRTVEYTLDGRMLEHAKGRVRVPAHVSGAGLHRDPRGGRRLRPPAFSGGERSRCTGVRSWVRQPGRGIRGWTKPNGNGAKRTPGCGRASGLKVRR